MFELTKTRLATEIELFSIFFEKIAKTQENTEQNLKKLSVFKDLLYDNTDNLRKVDEYLLTLQDTNPLKSDHSHFLKSNQKLPNNNSTMNPQSNSYSLLEQPNYNNSQISTKELFKELYTDPNEYTATLNGSSGLRFGVDLNEILSGSLKPISNTIIRNFKLLANQPLSHELRLHPNNISIKAKYNDIKEYVNYEESPEGFYLGLIVAWMIELIKSQNPKTLSILDNIFRFVFQNKISLPPDTLNHFCEIIQDLSKRIKNGENDVHITFLAYVMNSIIFQKALICLLKELVSNAKANQNTMNNYDNQYNIGGLYPKNSFSGVGIYINDNELDILAQILQSNIRLTIIEYNAYEEKHISFKEYCINRLNDINIIHFKGISWIGGPSYQFLFNDAYFSKLNYQNTIENNNTKERPPFDNNTNAKINETNKSKAVSNKSSNPGKSYDLPTLNNPLNLNQINTIYSPFNYPEISRELSLTPRNDPNQLIGSNQPSMLDKVPFDGTTKPKPRQVTPVRYGNNSTSNRANNPKNQKKLPGVNYDRIHDNKIPKKTNPDFAEAALQEESAANTSFVNNDEYNQQTKANNGLGNENSYAIKVNEETNIKKELPLALKNRISQVTDVLDNDSSKLDDTYKKYMNKDVKTPTGIATISNQNVFLSYLKLCEIDNIPSNISKTNISPMKDPTPTQQYTLDDMKYGDYVNKHENDHSEIQSNFLNVPSSTTFNGLSLSSPNKSKDSNDGIIKSKNAYENDLLHSTPDYGQNSNALKNNKPSTRSVTETNERNPEPFIGLPTGGDYGNESSKDKKYDNNNNNNSKFNNILNSFTICINCGREFLKLDDYKGPNTCYLCR